MKTLINPIQIPLFLMSQWEEGSIACNTLHAVLINKKINKFAAEKAIVSILQEQDALSSSYFMSGGSPLAVPSRHVSSEEAVFFHENHFELLHLRHREELVSCLEEKLKEPISLESPPLIRVHFFILSEKETIIAIFSHHMVMDGFSITLFLDTFLNRYSKILVDSSIEMNRKYPYSRYTKLLNEYLSTEKIKHDIKNWASKILKVNTSDYLFNKRSNHPGMSFDGDVVCLSLDSSESSAFRFLSRNYNVSPFIFALSLFYIVMANITGSLSQVIGTAMLNRQEKEHQKIMGLFVNTLPLVVSLDENACFKDLVDALKREVFFVYQNQEIPLSLLEEEVFKVSGESKKDLFRVLLVEMIPFKERSYEDMKITPISTTSKYSRQDMTVYLDSSSKTVSFYFEFNTSVFSKSIVESMASSCRNLLQIIQENENKSIFSIPMLSELFLCFKEESKRGEVGLIEQYLAVVESMPNSVALIGKEEEITYSELEGFVSKIEEAIRSFLSKEKHVITLLMDKSWKRIAAMIAVLKSNNTVLVVDYSQGKPRIEQMISKAKSSMILVDSESNKEYISHDAVININALNKMPLSPKEEKLYRDNRGDDTAFIVFTSGSTGSPKGVKIKESGIMNRLLWSLENFPFSDKDTCIHLSSGVFVDAIAEIFSPLLSGIPAVIAPNSSVICLNDLSRLINKYKVTRLLIIPSLFSYFISHCENSGDLIPSCKLFFTSGEYLPKTTVSKFFDYFDGRSIVNVYGSSEVTADASFYKMTSPPEGNVVPIGRPLRGANIVILNPGNKCLGIGMPGQIAVSGACLSGGYIDQKNTEERFISISDREGNSREFFLTGDYGRFSPEGDLIFLGRKDSQIKIRGMRVDLQEVEGALLCDERILQVFVEKENENLIAFYVSKNGDELEKGELKELCYRSLPHYMIPYDFINIPKFPRLPTGKINISALKRKATKSNNVEKTGQTYKKIEEIFMLVLGVDCIDDRTHFFDLGGNSLKLIELRLIIKNRLGIDVSISDLFKYPSLTSLSKFLDQVIKEGDKKLCMMPSSRAVKKNNGSDKIAIVGISGRFPGSDSAEDLWDSLLNKKSGIVDINLEEMSSQARSLKELYSDRWVCRSGRINNIDSFDAELFGVTSQEATFLDPQHRLFLECCWEALDDAAINTERSNSSIGVYAGCSPSTYLLSALYHKISIDSPERLFTIMSSNGENYLSTRVAYKFNLKGPAISVQTACSTSLVAIDTAINALKSNSCDIALAGGVTVKVPQDCGYLYTEGSMVSSDGCCRPFSEHASGTVFSNGAGVVVLKRLEDAVRDRDNIYAVLLGSAVNNDGSDKLGYAAPSIAGQVEVIEKAITNAGISHEDIDYVEAHGTGTYIGDEIELSALQQVFKKGCILGSLKSNIGHLDSAAGVAGLIKVAMMLKKGVIAASLSGESPTTAFDWSGRGFTLASDSFPWPDRGVPRRAGVSSFGIGGTNAHVVLEEYIPSDKKEVSKSSFSHLIVLSAESEKALSEKKERLKACLIKEKNFSLPDIAYTLQVGRKELSCRFFLVVSSIEEVIKCLPMSQEEVLTISKQKDINLFLLGMKWVDGNDIAWFDFWRNNPAHKVSLPSYPFQRKKFWFEPKILLPLGKKDLPLSHEAINSNAYSEAMDRPEEMSTQYIPPESDLEIAIFNIWKNYFGYSSIGTNDHFLELGGDSIMAIQVLSDIKKFFSVNVDLSSFYLSPTISFLADQVSLHEAKKETLDNCDKLLL